MPAQCQGFSTRHVLDRQHLHHVSPSLSSQWHVCSQIDEFIPDGHSLKFMANRSGVARANVIAVNMSMNNTAGSSLLHPS
jgi:hypothetical protein